MPKYQFEWDEKIKHWRCMRCGSVDVKVIRFDQETRLRSDVDQKLVCAWCSNTEIM
jgi:hypothetical protein